MRIVLFRHGIAIDRADPACPAEEERFLTEEGGARTAAAARGLRQLGVAPDRILSSPWTRARQTAEIAATALGLDAARIEFSEALLPFSPPDELLDLVAMPASLELLVVGHAPHLDEALALLTGGGSARLKKAGAACIETVELARGAGRLPRFSL